MPIIVKQDAELMKNILPANPVPVENRFTGFVDEQGHPALFSLSQDHKLNLIIEQNGVRILHDYGEILGIPGDIQAFDAQQNADGTVSVAIAAVQGTGSGLWLVYGLLPAQLLDPPAQNVFHDATTFPVIHYIFMSNFVTDIGGFKLPQIFVALQPPDRITKEDQLVYLKFAVSGGQVTMTLNSTWKLATNPEKIIDVAFSTNRLGQGVFVLYQSQIGMRLQFKTFAGSDFAVEPVCPANAQSIASYVDTSTGESVLIVAGQNVVRFAFNDYKSPKGTGHVIPTPPDVAQALASSFTDIRNMHIAQKEAELTIWYTTARLAAFYFSTTCQNIVNGQGTLVPLLGEGKAGQISGMLSALDDKSGTLVKSLLTVDSKGNLKVLQQAMDTNLWGAHPFYTASATNNMEVMSYTIRFTTTTDGTANDPKIANCKLFLRASGALGATLNGVSTSLTQDGDWYQADGDGALTFIVSTESYACSTIQCEKFISEDGHEQVITSAVLDPSYKASLKLMDVQPDGNYLLNVKTQTGEQLIAPGTVSKEDADNAAQMLYNLNQAHLKLTDPAQNEGKLRLDNSSARAMTVSEVTATPLPSRFICGKIHPNDKVMLESRVSIRGFFDDVWEWFEWLGQKVAEVTSWLVEKVGDFLNLILVWGGKVFTFVLDTVTAVAKAVSWVFDKIVVGIKKIIEFIGFLFSWGDILECSDSLVTFINAGLGYSETRLDDLNAYAQQWIAQLQASMKDPDRKKAPEVTVSSQTGNDFNTKASETHHTVAFNWSGDQMKSGGFATNSTLHSGDGPSDADRLQQIWNDIVGIVKDLEQLVIGIGGDIGDLFNGHTSTSAIFERLQDQLVETALSTLSKVVDALINAIALLINTFKEMGNYKIEVPIFSALWKLITGGRDFTLFNFFSLVVAIPATILCKLVTGKKMPKLSGRLTPTTFGKYVNGDAGSVDANFKSDMIVFSTASVIGAGIIGVVVEVITLAIDAIPMGGRSSAMIVRFQRSLPGPGTPRAMATSPKVGNAIDAASLTCSLFGLYASWPLNDKLRDRDLRWAIWGLDVSDSGFLAMSRAVGFSFNIPRVQTKKFLGIWQVCTSIPRFVLQMIICAHDYQLPPSDPDKNDSKTTMHVVEGIAGMSATWASGVAAVTDGNPATEEITLIATAVMILSYAIKYSLKTAEWLSDHL